MAWGRYRLRLAQKTTVYSLRRRAWGGPQLVAQALSQRFAYDERVQKVERHVGEAHPELVGKMTRADVLGMAEDA